MKHFLWLVLLGCVAAQAQLRCDCSVQEGDCQATVGYEKDLVEIVTDTQQCAQVIFYVDGQPQVTVVTDGRDVKPLTKQSYQQLVAGNCRVCKAREVAKDTAITVALKCDADYLLETDQTRQCLQTCTDIDHPRDRAVCKNNCQQYSHCLEKNCVQSLRQKFERCERQCDRDMQSSMAADIDSFNDCQDNCKAIKEEIQSCPIL